MASSKFRPLRSPHKVLVLFLAGCPYRRTLLEELLNQLCPSEMLSMLPLADLATEDWLRILAGHQKDQLG
jgi:hypothetical protein